MKIAFRADASTQIGTGHVMRCLTLADTLRSKGASILFICRDHPGNLCDLIVLKGFEVSRLCGEQCFDTENLQERMHEFDDGPLDHALWLGVTQENDASQMLNILQANAPWDWLIVDHYALDYRWESTMRSVAKKIMVIDDLADRKHDCDLLLDQNYSPKPYERYHGLVPYDSQCLLGPLYALLRKEYFEHRRLHKKHVGRVKKALIFFGGSDPENLTGLTIEALSQGSLKHIELDVLPGSNCQNIRLLEKQAASRGRTTLHGQLPHLAGLMSLADLGIGAGGGTTWERLCLGLPSIVIATAQNQYPACCALSEAAFIEYIGTLDEVNRDVLATKIKKLLSDPKRLIELSNQGMQVVDGLGAQRVVEFLQ